jgi:hypothetical protein
MSGEVVVIDRAALLAELQRAFDAQTAGVLLDVLEKVAVQVHATSVTREDFGELRRIVEELAEAQRRTEERVGELAKAQRRTEERVGELAEAQRRTEERVGSLELAVERLAEAQRRTEQAVARLSRQVGGLSETVGGDIEDIAYIVLHDVLKREFGWQVGVLERSWQVWDGKMEEVNVFGQAIWIVGEAKHNLSANEVKKFTRQVERARKHLVGQIFPVCFCYRARPEVQQMVLDAGIRLVFSYGKLV